MENASDRIRNMIRRREAEKQGRSAASQRLETMRKDLNALTVSLEQAIVNDRGLSQKPASYRLRSTTTSKKAELAQDVEMAEDGQEVAEDDDLNEDLVSALKSIEDGEKIQEEAAFAADPHGNQDFDFGAIRDGPGDITIDDKTFAIHDYFGDAFSKMIRELRACVDLDDDLTSTILTTTLFPHQKVAVAKLIFLINGFTEGGILADEMGLGKTLATLVALRIDRQRRGCFDLVVTSKTTAIQWKQEAEVHFQSAHQMKTIILTDPTMSSHELLQQNYELVIVTYQFLAAQYRKLKGFLAAQDRKLRGLDSSQRSELVALSIFSPIYNMLELPIKHLVIDEANYGQDIQGLSHQAFTALYRTSTVLITGTPFKNRWSSIYPLIDLLPGHPFKTEGIFQHAFGPFSSLRQSTQQFNRLVKFLQAITICRPADILQLPNARIIRAEFNLNAVEDSLSTYWFLRWQHVLKRLREKRAHAGQPGPVNEAADFKVTYPLLLQATQYAVHPALAAKTSKIAATEAQKLKQRIADIYHEHTKDKDTKTDPLFTAANGPPTTGPFERPDWEELLRDHEEALELYGRVRYLFNAPGVSLGKLFEGLDNKDKKKKTTAPPAQKDKVRKQWLERVSKMSPNELYSSRVRKIIELIQSFPQTHPGQKIAIFSRYLKLLDIIAEALERLGKKDNGIQCLRFDGTMDASARISSRYMFRRSQSPTTVMLITAGAGGAGMNLNSASIVIQAEPWWVATEEWQAWFRVRRPGQEREVSIYVLEGSNSLVDIHIAQARDSKAEVIGEFMNHLRLLDEEELIIPHITRHW